MCSVIQETKDFESSPDESMIGLVQQYGGSTIMRVIVLLL